MDLDNRKGQVLKAIPRFEHLYPVPPEKASQQFDLISLIHSRDCFTDPSAMLRALRGWLPPGGRLFIQVNNAARTQLVQVVVAGRLCHLTPQSLAYLLTRAGYGVETVALEWIDKEISLLASKERLREKPRPTKSSVATKHRR